jgi:hypothetical protein
MIARMSEAGCGGHGVMNPDAVLTVAARLLLIMSRHRRSLSLCVNEERDAARTVSVPNGQVTWTNAVLTLEFTGLSQRLVWNCFFARNPEHRVSGERNWVHFTFDGNVNPPLRSKWERP